jgi:hypothetical protein
VAGRRSLRLAKFVRALPLIAILTVTEKWQA